MLQLPCTMPTTSPNPTMGVAAQVAVLHSRKLDPEETALQRTLMATLAQRHPKLFSRMATGMWRMPMRRP